MGLFVEHLCRMKIEYEGYSKSQLGVDSEEVGATVAVR